MRIQLTDARVRALPIRESGDPLVALPSTVSPRGCLVRSEVARRLLAACAALPAGVGLRVEQGHVSAAQHLIAVARRTAQVCAARPGVGPDELDRLVQRVVAPAGLSPHLTGSAVTLTVTGGDTQPSAGGRGGAGDRGGAVPLEAAAAALRAAGLVSHPGRSTTWSWGDRYWAALTGAPFAVHGPVAVPRDMAA